MYGISAGRIHLLTLPYLYSAIAWNCMILYPFFCIEFFCWYSAISFLAMAITIFLNKYFAFYLIRSLLMGIFNFISYDITVNILIYLYFSPLEKVCIPKGCISRSKIPGLEILILEYTGNCLYPLHQLSSLNTLLPLNFSLGLTFLKNFSVDFFISALLRFNRNIKLYSIVFNLWSIESTNMCRISAVPDAGDTKINMVHRLQLFIIWDIEWHLSLLRTRCHASSTPYPPFGTMKNGFRHCQVPPDGKIPPLPFENHWVR